MASSEYWHAAKEYLSSVDPVLGAVIASYQGEMLQSKGDAFLTLTRAIVGQQISVKAASAVWKKLEDSIGTLSPLTIIEAAEDNLRACGLSRQKIAYLKDLSHHFFDKADLEAQWSSMDDDAVINSLISIKGIGQWTAEMFLIFYLARPDVFPVDDLGVRKAIERLYFKGEKQPPKILRAHALLWQPYRSAATWYLWRSLDPLPVEY